MKYSMTIDGEDVESETERTFDVTNPGNGELIAKVPEANGQDTRKAIDAAREAFDRGSWPRMTPVVRSVVLQNVADILEQNLGSGVSRPTRKQQSNFICEEKKY